MKTSSRSISDITDNVYTFKHTEYYLEALYHVKCIYLCLQVIVLRLKCVFNRTQSVPSAVRWEHCITYYQRTRHYGTLRFVPG